MKIAIIADSIERGPTSIGKYTENLVRKLLKIIKDENIEIILIHGERQSLEIYEKAREIIVPFFERKSMPYFFPIRVILFLFNIVFDLIRIAKIIRFCKKEKVLIHIPHLGRPAPPVPFMFYTGKLVVTNHGMANLALSSKLCYREKMSLSRFFNYIDFLKWKFIFKSKFDYMVTVSHSEKRNILRNLGIPPEKIKVVYHGADYKNYRLKRNREAEKILHQKYEINFPFILHLSAYQPKKNVEGIIKAFAIAKKKYKIKEKLVIGGKQPDHLKRLVEDLGIEDDVIFVGFIPEEELPIFYGTAEAFIFPSFHESFGMPVLEAMACGCPVITSNVFSMPEVAGKAAIFVNPYSTEEIAEAIYEIVTNRKLRRKLAEWGIERAKKFTWERCAGEHLKIYLEACQK